MSQRTAKLAGFFCLLAALGAAAYFGSGLLHRNTPARVVDSPDRTFSFTLPAGCRPPAISDQPPGVASLDITSQSEQGAFVVRRMCVPEAVWENQTPKEMLTSAREKLLRAAGGEMDHEEDIRLHGNLCRSLRFHVGTGQYSRMDFILARPNVFVLTCTSSQSEALDRPEVREFFESLALKEDGHHPVTL